MPPSVGASRREKTIKESALARVSIRKYTDEPISKEQILEVLELAGKAPSAFNVQPWRFIAITEPGVKIKMQEASYGQPQVGSAPVLLVLTSDMEDALAKVDDLIHPGLPEDKRDGTRSTILNTFGAMPAEQRAAWGRGQSYIALGYLLLALESLGFGSSPMLGFEPDKVRAVLGLAEHVEIPALVAFGRPAEAGFPQHRLPVSTVSRFIE